MEQIIVDEKQFSSYAKNYAIENKIVRKIEVGNSCRTY